MAPWPAKGGPLHHNGSGTSRNGALALRALCTLWLALMAFLACEDKRIEKGRINLSLGDYPLAIRCFREAVEGNLAARWEDIAKPLKPIKVGSRTIEDYACAGSWPGAAASILR